MSIPLCPNCMKDGLMLQPSDRIAYLTNGHLRCKFCEETFWVTDWDGIGIAFQMFLSSDLVKYFEERWKAHYKEEGE